MKYYVYEQEFSILRVDEYKEDDPDGEYTSFQLSDEVRERLQATFAAFQEANCDAYHELFAWQDLQEFLKRPEYEI